MYGVHMLVDAYVQQVWIAFQINRMKSIPGLVCELRVQDEAATFNEAVG